LVANAAQRVEALYVRAGPYEEAFRLRGMPPKERARKAWARLRHHNVEPLLVVAVWIAVEMVIGADAQAVDTKEFKHVQAAKIVHRLASGTHKKWSQGAGGTKELHVYPPSRGQVLRHIGADVERAVGILASRALPLLQQDAAGETATLRARPRKLAVRRRA
jgi:hypothetical protein